MTAHEPPRPQGFPSATPRVADEGYRTDVVAWFAEHVRADREENSRELRDCLAVPCPRCHAEASSRCRQTAGNRVLTDRAPIEVPHLQRRKAYREQE